MGRSHFLDKTRNRHLTPSPSHPPPIPAMSFLSRRDDDGDHRRTRQHHHHQGRKTAPPTLDLLDEYWFFSNTLVVKNNNNGKGGGAKPPPLPRSPSTSTKLQQGGLGCRRLLRTPSLPSPCVGMEEMPPSGKDDELVEEEVDDDDLNWSSIYEGILRTRMAEGNSSRSPALHRAPSMPVPSSAINEEMATKSTPSMPRLRHSYSTLERHTPSTNHSQQPEQTPRTVGGERRHPRREVRSFSANQQPMVKSVFQEVKKKWKSWSDLESIEVKGFKDLGFIFDKEKLRENLADVLPGLKSSAPAGGNRRSGNNGSNAGGGHGAAVPRPYLSDAWHHMQRPPAPIRDARSAAEMKDQLRMWAQAVACNVRQEC